MTLDQSERNESQPEANNTISHDKHIESDPQNDFIDDKEMQPDHSDSAVAVLEEDGRTVQEVYGGNGESEDASALMRDLGIREDLFDEERYTIEEYQKMLEMYEGTFSNIEEGEIVEGTVLRIDGSNVILDVGFKSEGSVPLDEFKEPDQVLVGDTVGVFLENLEDQDGVIVLSKKKADFYKVWDRIKEAYEAQETVSGTLVNRIKGGIVVDLFGVDAFLPGSQIALRRITDMDQILGDTYDLKIIKLNKKRRNIVVSRRVILENEREENREKLLKEIAVGQELEGTVKNITDFGVFMDLGGLDGLLHITDMSWGRVSHPSELAAFGDKIKVKIIDIDSEKNRISLGLKQLSLYPWENAEEKYPVGKKVRGKVVSITNYGAFVELEKGIEGLVHISEMSWTKHIRHPSKILAIGDTIEAIVLSIDAKEEKISLGIKQIEEDPWESLAERYPPSTKLEGKVRNLTPFGAFVEIEEGIDGLVHISDMSWTKRVHHPNEVVKKGDRVEVVVLNIDAENRRISLGMKQVKDNPWKELGEIYKVGVKTTGTVTRILDKGVNVNLGSDVEGFVPMSHLGLKDPKKLSKEVKLATVLDLEVIESEPENRRIVLSAVKAFADKVARDEELREKTIESAPSTDREESEVTATDLESQEISGDQVVIEGSLSEVAKELNSPSEQIAESDESDESQEAVNSEDVEPRPAETTASVDSSIEEDDQSEEEEK